LLIILTFQGEGLVVVTPY